MGSMNLIVHSLISGLLSGSTSLALLLVLGGGDWLKGLALWKALAGFILFFLVFSAFYRYFLRGFLFAYLTCFALFFLYAILLQGLGWISPIRFREVLAFVPGLAPGVFYLYQVFEHSLPLWNPLRRAEEFQDLTNESPRAA